MDRIIEVKVFGNHLTKDNKNAGTKGEANVTRLRITFDGGWDNYEKEIFFWDAYGQNAVRRVLTTDLIEDATESMRVYIVPIPAEAMARAGLMTFMITGYQNGKKQVSVSGRLEVEDSPEILEPIDPTPTEVAQLQGEIEAIREDIQGVAIAHKETSESADKAAKEANRAETHATKARTFANKAEDAAGRVSYIGENGNWYAWDGKKQTFYDTGVKAQSGSTVYYGENPPPEADVWIDPNGESDLYTKNEVDHVVDALNNRIDGALSDLSAKADKSTTLLGYGITDAYDSQTVDGMFEPVYAFMGALDERKADKEYVDSKLEGKADKATSLLGYGITDAYTKSEVNAMIQGGVQPGPGVNGEIYANALKGTASGEAVRLSDVSPIEHTLSVKASSENLTDMSTVRLKKYGANMIDVAKAPFIFNATWNATSTKTPENYVWERTDTGFKGRYLKAMSSTSERIGFLLGNTEDFKGKTITVSVGEIILNQNALKSMQVILTSRAGTVADKVDENTHWNSVSSGYIGNTSTVKGVASVQDSHQVVATIPEDADSVTYPYVGITFYMGWKSENPAGSTFEFKDIRVQMGDEVIPPVIYTPNADGTVDGVTSLFPVTELVTDTEGIVLDVEYNRDLNKAFEKQAQSIEELMKAVNTLGGGA